MSRESGPVVAVCGLVDVRFAFFCCRIYMLPDCSSPASSEDRNTGTMTETMISLPRLVSTCADAARRGCVVIRSVQARREAVLADADEGDATSNGTEAADALREASRHGIQYKVDGDPRSALTEADGAAQEVILHCLRARWGSDLHIVGEEEEEGEGGGSTCNDEEQEDVFARYGVLRPEDVALKEDILLSASSSNGSSEQDVPLSSVTIYVDPMDGTREFVEGRLGNVQCLVGVVVDGRPVGGAVGLPFAGGRTETQEGKRGCDIPSIQVVHALLGEQPTLGRVSVSNGSSSTFDELPFLTPAAEDHTASTTTSSSSSRQLIVLSGDSRKPEKDLAIDHLRDICSDEGVELDIRTAGGCGTKIMQLALCAAAASAGDNGRDAIAVMTRGNCSWDTAAPTAVLEAALQQAAGTGRVSDFYGDRLVYDGVNVTNNLAVLASCGADTKRWHTELCKRLAKDKAVG